MTVRGTMVRSKVCNTGCFCLGSHIQHQHQHFMIFDISCHLTFDDIWNFMTFDISWHLTSHEIWHLTFHVIICLMTSYIWWHLPFDISCHLSFHVIWHFTSFDISCHLTFHVILVISSYILCNLSDLSHHSNHIHQSHHGINAQSYKSSFGAKITEHQYTIDALA